jgi:beta-glucosidase-like glycosyl hydrolase
VTHRLASLLVPQLRWDSGLGFTYLEEMIGDALDVGVGGFWISGGTRADVAALTRELHRRSRTPLLIGAEVDGGVGSTVRDATGLPPFSALAALKDSDVIRRAAKLTARELRALGVNWALGPIGDLEREPANPLLGSRSFGLDAQRAAEWVVEWVDAVQAEGVMACVRHFPGMGRAPGDPHLAPVGITTSAGTLWADDLLPFRGAADTGVASIMAASAAYPGLDATGRVAARSRPMLTELLRGELAYDGLIVSDVLSSPGLLQGDEEGIAAIEAVAAGCDLLLAPNDLHGVLEMLERGYDGGMISPDAIEESRNRRRFWADWSTPGEWREPTLDDVLWARKLADTLVYPVRGVAANVGPVVDVIQVDDDAQSRWPVPSRQHLLDTLRAMGHAPRLVDAPTPEGEGAVLLALHGGPGVGKGRAGYSVETRRHVARIVAEARQARRSVVVALFGPPRLAAEIPEASNVVCGWNGERCMQEAMARRLG